MKFFDHTIYTSTKIDRHDKTSALSVPSVVDTYQYSYVDNSDLIGSVTFPNGLVTTKTYETNRNLIDKVENNFNGKILPDRIMTGTRWIRLGKLESNWNLTGRYFNLNLTGRYFIKSSRRIRSFDMFKY